MGFLDKTGLELLWTHIQQLVNKKTNGLATETYVDEKISAIEPPSTEGLASEEYVNTAIANLVDSSPETLNTLNELADALGDDPNFATTMTTELSKKSTATNLVNGSAVGSLRTTGARVEENAYMLGNYAFSEGLRTRAMGDYSHAEGLDSIAHGMTSHAEGQGMAIGLGSHAEGKTKSSMPINITGEANSLTYSYTSNYNFSKLSPYKKSIIEYNNNYIQITDLTENTITFESTLDYNNALSETLVYIQSSGSFGQYSHAEGFSAAALGDYSHAEGNNTKAIGIGSHAEGYSTTANGDYQHVAGKNNIIDENGDYAYIIGNGAYLGYNSNAHTINWDGTGWFAKDVYIGGTGQNDTAAEKLVKQSELEAAAPSSNTPLQMLTTDAEGNTAWQGQTHYSYTAIGEIYPETTFTESDFNGDNILLTSPLKLELGKSYTVKYNDTEYYCTPYDNGTYYVLGNAQPVGGSFSDEPFTILALQNASSSPYGHLIPHDSSTSGSFSVLGEKEFIKTIDKKYLPTTIKNLDGKTFLILGDSINAGNGWAGGFANLIAEDFPEATVVNNAVEGSLLSGDNKAIYYQAVRAYQAGIRPDYIIIDGGGNDLLGQATVGTVDLDTYSAGGYGEEFDVSTIAGAFEYLITNVQKFNPHAKIIFFNLFKVLPTATEIPLASQRAAWSMLKTACEKYSVKYVDLFNEGNFNPYCEEQWNAFMYDWVHINEAGYRRFWPLIRDAL